METIQSQNEHKQGQDMPEAEIAIKGVEMITIMMVPDAGEGWQEIEVPAHTPSRFMLSLPA